MDEKHMKEFVSKVIGDLKAKLKAAVSFDFGSHKQRKAILRVDGVAVEAAIREAENAMRLIAEGARSGVTFRIS